MTHRVTIHGFSVPFSAPATETAFTHPDVLTIGVQEGWADPETDPTRISWPLRKQQALIPFAVVNGRPVRPDLHASVQRGRNGFGLWGENPMADAIVTANHNGHRRLLLVERSDGHGWAVPGGSIEAGESPSAAAARELQEETGLTITPSLWRPGTPRLVPDPRGSHEAWAVTVAARAHLGTVTRLPPVQGADDAAQAAWLPADSYDALTAHLAERSATLFAAHTAMLRQALGQGRRAARTSPAGEVE